MSRLVTASPRARCRTVRHCVPRHEQQRLQVAHRVVRAERQDLAPGTGIEQLKRHSGGFARSKGGSSSRRSRSAPSSSSSPGTSVQRSTGPASSRSTRSSRACSPPAPVTIAVRSAACRPAAGEDVGELLAGRGRGRLGGPGRPRGPRPACPAGRCAAVTGRHRGSRAAVRSRAPRRRPRAAALWPPFPACAAVSRSGSASPSARPGRGCRRRRTRWRPKSAPSSRAKALRSRTSMRESRPSLLGRGRGDVHRAFRDLADPGPYIRFEAVRAVPFRRRREHAGDEVVAVTAGRYGDQVTEDRTGAGRVRVVRGGSPSPGRGGRVGGGRWPAPVRRVRPSCGESADSPDRPVCSATRTPDSATMPTPAQAPRSSSARRSAQGEVVRPASRKAFAAAYGSVRGAEETGRRGEQDEALGLRDQFGEQRGARPWVRRAGRARRSGSPPSRRRGHRPRERLRRSAPLPSYGAQGCRQPRGRPRRRGRGGRWSRVLRGP